MDPSNRLHLIQGREKNNARVTTSTVPLPYVLSRSMTLLVSIKNLIKGDGDTSTKLDDFCQERIDIRSEVLVASSRTLLNVG